jgi:hypothetical protein
MQHGRAGLGLIGLGAVLLAAACTVWANIPPVVPPDTGTVPYTSVGSDGSSSTSPGGRTTPPGTPAASAGGAGGPGAAGPGSAAATARHGRRPVALTLPGQQSAPVVPEGVTDGQLDLPTTVSTLGWWSGGAGLGDPAGSIVIAGHVDSAQQGLGYFAALRDLRPGQQVQLRADDHRMWSFVVTGRRSYVKAQGLPGSVFDQSVATRLVLITCTGRFDPGRHSYEDNLVVYAVPVGR